MTLSIFGPLKDSIQCKGTMSSKILCSWRYNTSLQLTHIRLNLAQGLIPNKKMAVAKIMAIIKTKETLAITAHSVRKLGHEMHRISLE